MGTDIKNVTIKIRVGNDPQFKDFEFSKLSGSGNIGTGNLLYHNTKQYPIASLLNQGRTDQLSSLTDNKKFQAFLAKSPTVSAEKTEDGINLINNNIIDTLFVLFPTYFEQRKNITTSYDERISKESIRTKYNLFQIKKSFFTPKEEGDDEYTYYNDKTVDKLVWLNDVYNVPEYAELMAAVYKFFRYMKVEGKKQVENNVINNTEILKKDNIQNSLAVWIGELNKGTTSGTSGSPESVSTQDILDNYNNFIEPIDSGMTPEQIEAKQKTKDENVKKIMTRLNSLEDSIVENERSTSTKSDTLKKIIKAFTPLVSSYKIKQMFATNGFLIKNEKIRFSKEEERLYNQLKEYKEYITFEEAIQKFKKEVLKSSNPDLESLFTDFQDNSKGGKQAEFLYFVLAVYKVSSNPELIKNLGLTPDDIKKIQPYETKKNLLYVGPVLIPSGKYLVYVGLDVISTKLSRKEHTSKNCVYKNEKLGDFTVSLYNKLFGSYISGIENFIVLNKEYILNLPKPPSGQPGPQGQPGQPMPPSKGGSRFSRKKKATRRRSKTHKKEKRSKKGSRYTKHNT